MKPETLSRVRKTLITGVGQFALIVASILIALQFENWNEAEKQASQRRVLLAKIRNELASNHGAIKAALAKRQAFFVELKARSNAWSDIDRRQLYLDLPEADRIQAWPGLAPMRLEVALFETAKFTGLLTDLAPGFLVQLSQLYAQQAVINSIGRGLLNQLFLIDYDTRIGDVVRLYWRVQEEFFGAQQLLLPKIEAVLDTIDTHNI